MGKPYLIIHDLAWLSHHITADSKISPAIYLCTHRVVDDRAPVGSWPSWGPGESSRAGRAIPAKSPP